MRHILILAALLCVSCGTQLPSIKPFKLDIQQGNVVTSKMLLQLRPGMTKSQVRFIMGTPLVQDSFHGNRWDYVYQMRENGKLVEQRRVILDFEKELLKSVRGDVVPAGSELAKEPETAAPTGTRVVPPVKAQKEKGLLDKLKFWADDEPKPEAVAPVKQEMQPKQEMQQSVKQAPAAAASPAGEAQPAASQTQAEEAPSMLAVPIAVPAADGAAESAAIQPESASPAPVTDGVVSQPAVAEPNVPSPMPETSIVPLAAPAAAPAAMAEEVPNTPVAKPDSPTRAAPAAPAESAPPPNPYHYQSPAGMQFDRRLQIEEEEEPPVIEPSGSRAGNKVAPQPKPLPPETEPSFFDRMLEQIGF